MIDNTTKTVYQNDFKGTFDLLKTYVGIFY